MLYPIAVCSFLAVLVVWLFRRLRSLFSVKLPYPPGPRNRGFLSGNYSHFTVERAWLLCIEMGKRYGDILHFRDYTKHTIILNSYEDNLELLEKRSAIYSDRPYMPVLELMEWVINNTGLMRYGNAWRLQRRAFQEYFKADVVPKYRPTQTRKVHDFIYSLLSSPDDFADHFRTFAASVVMSITYGHDVAAKGDYFVRLAEDAVGRLSVTTLPGTSLFYSFPVLLKLPAWLPGAGFIRYILEGRDVVLQLRNVPLGIVQKKMENGVVNCIAAELLESSQSKEEADKVVPAVVTTIYGAGADTTVSSLGTFFLAMVMFPEVQRKAQQEIDAVVGNNRLVNYDDQFSLSYIQALQREVMRWRPALPFSVPHATSSDDVYKGYYIPKGTTVMSNLWSIAHDPIKYPEPDVFNPSRFFDDSGRLNDDDVGYVFGFGRRVCAGRHLASATVWLAIATVLQNFDIKKKKDINGKDIPISGEYSGTLVIHPLHFECSITPRSNKASKVIQECVQLGN